MDPRDELEVIRSMYPDLEEVIIEQNKVTLKISEICLVVTLPPGYPETPPNFNIEYWPNNAESRRELLDRLSTMHSPGTPVLFMAFQEFKESVLQLLTEPNTNVSTQPHKVPHQVVPPDLTIYSGPCVTVMKSTFQAHVCRVCSEAQVLQAKHQLLRDRKLAKASHPLMSAFRIRTPNLVLSDNDDDGEKGAGSKLAHLLDLLKVENLLVCVSRWYGGVHMGPTRFKVINNVARELLVAQGFLEIN